MNKRIIIRKDELDHIDGYDIDEIIRKLQDIKEENKDCSRIFVDTDWEWKPYETEATRIISIIGIK